MDKKLKLLKTYLDSRVKSYEKLTGLPLGEQVLEMRMLVNSDPGLIRLFVGSGTPAEDRARTIDVWYNQTGFFRKAVVGWVAFDKYQEEFTTTILDAYSDEFPVDVPLKLEIEGPTFIDLMQNRTAEYRVYMTLESGRRFYLDEAEISVRDHSNRIIMTTDPKTGVGTANFTALINTTNFKVKARFKLGDFATLEGSLDAQAFLEGTTVNEAYTLFVEGPASIKYGETGNYKATLQTVFVESGETTTQDVTNMVAWSADFDGNMSLHGAYTPARPEPVSLNTTVRAVLTKALGNGTTFDIQGSKDITVIRMAVREVLVEGAERVKENEKAQYKVKVVFMNGDIVQDYTPVDWALGEPSLGSVDTAGLYSAPMVEADTVQTIEAHIQFEGDNHMGEKAVVVEDVAAPILTITGPAKIYDRDTAGFTAQLTFDGRTFDVTPDVWAVANTAHGSININGVFRPNSTAENVNVTIQASMTYKGYHVEAEAPLLVYASALRPVSMSISGAAQVVEGTTSNYVAIAIMSDGTEVDVTNQATWSVSDQNHSLSAAGILTAGQVNFDVNVTITAIYALNGVQQVATRDVRIKDDPVIWTPVSLAINGPTSVNEEEKAQYTATVTMTSNKGETKTVPNATVEWRVNANGTIAQTGELTAASVVATTTAIVSAIYSDGQNLPLTQSLTVTITNVPLLVSLTLAPQATSIFGGFNTTFTTTLLKKTGAPVDVTAHASTTYITNPPNLVTIDKANKRLVAATTPTTVSVQITANYSEAGESKTATATLEVKANTANSLIVTPGSIDLFEGETVQLHAELALSSGTNAPVSPTYAFDSSLGTVNASGLFTAAQVSADSSGVLTAKYSGAETGGTEVTSNEVPVTVKNIAPELLELFTDNGIYSMPEGQNLYLSSKVHFNNGRELLNDVGVVYSIRPEDEAVVTITPDVATGTLKVFGKDVTVDKVVPITATFTHPDAPGGALTATKLITVKYQRQVVGLVLSMDAGPYFKTRNYNLTLRERYDDNSLSANITSGISWSFDPSLLSIANGVANIKADSGNFTISASKGGVTSNTVTGAISSNRPVSIEIYSDEGSDLNRDQITTLSASMIMADGTTITPSSTWPVTWALEHTNAGTKVDDGTDYTTVFTAASLLADASVKVTATCAGVSTTLTLNVHGYPVVTGVTLSGPNTVESGKNAQYELTVNYSDNSVVKVNAGSTATANFSLAFTDPRFTAAGSISNKGTFVAPKHAQVGNVPGKINASWFDENMQQTFNAVPYDVNISAAVPVTAKSAVINGASTMNAAAVQEYSMVVTMTDDTTVVINSSSQQTAVWSATKGTLVNGRYTSEGSPSGYTETISATYGGVTATKTVTVNPTVATSLIATPTSINIFEGKTQALTVKTNTGVTVKPVWTLGNVAAGSMNQQAELFTGAAVTSDVTTTLQGKYSGPETNNTELQVTLSVTVKDLTPNLLTLTQLTGGSNAVDEEGTATFKSVIRLTDSTTFDATGNVVYTVTAGSAYVTVNEADGILTVTGLNVTANQNVTLRGVYTHTDGKTVTGNLNIVVRNTIQRVADVVVAVANPKAAYYEGETVALVVREKYDDGMTGAPITSGLTWTVSNNALASVSGTTATLNAVTGDQNVTFSATYNGRTSSVPLSLTITDIVPASVAITSSNGNTIKRGASTTFTAKITLNNGSVVDPSASYPITWSNTNSGAGSFTSVSQTYAYTAAASNTDVLFDVKATTANNKVGTLNVTLDGYPIPTSAVIEGLDNVAAGTTTDYTMKVTMSDASVRSISATQTTYAAVWASTVSFAGSGGSFNTANGRLVAGSTAAARAGKVSATYTDSVSGLSVPAEKNINVLAAAVVPSTAALTGPASLAAGAVGEYVLTVTMSDGSTVVVDSSSVETATWTKTIAGGTLVNGKFTAPSAGSPSSGDIVANYTKNGQSIQRQMTVNVAAQVTTTTPAPGSWQDAVYVGEIPHNYGEYLLNNDATMVSRLTNLLLYTNSFDGGLAMIRKVADGTNKFAAQTINMDYWNDSTGAVTKSGSPGNITERMIVLYPKKYGKYVGNYLESEASGNWFDYTMTDTADPASPFLIKKVASDLTTPLNPAGDPMTISLPINGTPTEFYVYLEGSGSAPTSGQNRTVMKIRTK